MTNIIASYSALIVSVINLVWLALRGNRRGPRGFTGERGLPGDVVGYGPVPPYEDEPELPYVPPFGHDEVQEAADEEVTRENHQ